MSHVIVTGHILVPLNELEQVKDALTLHQKLTLNEPGCLVFRVTQDTTQTHRFNVYEVFVDEAAFSAHQARIKTSQCGKVTANVTRHYHINTHSTALDN